MAQLHPVMGSLPGTVTLIGMDDQGHSVHVGNTDVILVPTPSADPEDPLNWTTRRKYLAITCICV
jgi:hypothetical protein